MMSTRSPVSGCVKASRAAWRNWRSRPRSPPAPRRPGRPTTGARSPRGARGSGASVPVSSRTRSSACSATSSLDLEVRDGLPRRRRCRASAASGRGGRGRSAPRCGRSASAGGRGRARGTRARARARRTRRCSARVRLLGCARRRAAPTCRGRAGGRSPAARSSPPAMPCASSAVHERAGRWPGAGMDDEPGGLVDHEQVLVLVGDAERERPRGSSALRLGAPCSNSSVLPAREPMALRARVAVDEHRARRRSAARRPRASRLGRDRQEAVEPRRRPRRQERVGGASDAPRRGSRSDAEQRDEQDHDADHDEAVGEVERRPVAGSRGSRSRARGGRGR